MSVQVMGIAESRSAHAAPRMAHVGRRLGCPLETGGLAVGTAPSFQVGFLGPACPTASPWLSGPCPAGRAPHHQRSGGGAAGKPLCLRSAGVRWENILYRSVAHATWSLAAETGWGETKLKSILCLINDCLYRESRRRTLGSALSRRHIWAGMRRRCCGAFVVLAWKETGSFLLLFVLFSFLSLALGQVAWRRTLLQRAGGVVVLVFRLLAERFGAPRCTPGILQGGFSCLLCVISSWNTHALLMAVLEPRDPSAPGSASLSGLGPR